MSNKKEIYKEPPVARVVMVFCNRTILAGSSDVSDTATGHIVPLEEEEG